MPTFEIELPAALIDDLIEDSASAVVGQQPVLINQDPEPLEAGVPRSTNIQLDIATLAASGTIDVSATLVFVNGQLAFDGGVFHTAFGGDGSGFSNPQSDVLRVIVDPTVDFTSLSVVSVRVVTQAVGDVAQLDETYIFTIEDTLAPFMMLAEAQDLTRVRVRFNEPVIQTAEAPNSALLPANWTVDRFGDYVHPIVSAEVADVEATGDGAFVDLIMDIPLTPGGTYRLTARDIEDNFGNAVDVSNSTIEFLGWQPPVPAGRSFDLYRKIPALNRREDTTLDLLRFVGCIQEVANLLLYDIDQFVDFLDPDTAPEAAVDTMLLDLGMPFDFDLSLADKRRLANVLVDMYRLKGTGPGIINVIRFFLGLEVTISTFNDASVHWTLGESLLGVDTVLATSESRLLYSFEVRIDALLTEDQRKRLTTIVDYMKPGHTHFVRLREPTPPPVVEDHLVLGVSELGVNWTLH